MTVALEKVSLRMGTDSVPETQCIKFQYVILNGPKIL
jgi:hypothetical protein